MYSNPTGAINEEKMQSMRSIAAQRKDWKGLVRAVTTAKNIEWYDNYCERKRMGDPVRYDMPEKRSRQVYTPEHRERQEFTQLIDEANMIRREKRINPGAPTTRQRLHRYQEDNPSHIDK